jgi:hypothetical protein
MPDADANQNILSSDDKILYEQMAQYLHSLVYILTATFLQDKTKRKEIVSELRDFYLIISRKGCGSLCYDKQQGCHVCTYEISKPKSSPNVGESSY